MIKFNKYFVTDGANKARVFYSYGLCGYPIEKARNAVSIYARDFDSGDALAAMFKESGGYSNNTDVITDLFDEGSVYMYEEHPHYAAAFARYEANEAARVAKKAAKLASKLAVGAAA